jgi:hypothetical protein
MSVAQIDAVEARQSTEFFARPNPSQQDQDRLQYTAR